MCTILFHYEEFKNVLEIFISTSLWFFSPKVYYIYRFGRSKNRELDKRGATKMINEKSLTLIDALEC